MTQNEFFLRGLLTLLMVIGSVREYRRGNEAIAAVLIGVPVLAWLSEFWRAA